MPPEVLATLFPGASEVAETFKQVALVEENTATDGIELSAEQVERLNNLTPAAGEPMM